MRRGSAGATPLTRPVGVARGAPALGIAWPLAPTVVSNKDAQAPLFADAEYNFAF